MSRLQTSRPVGPPPCCDRAGFSALQASKFSHFGIKALALAASFEVRWRALEALWTQMAISTDVASQEMGRQDFPCATEPSTMKHYPTHAVSNIISKLVTTRAQRLEAH